MEIATRPTEGEANVTTLETSEGGVDAPDLRYFKEPTRGITR